MRIVERRAQNFLPLPDGRYLLTGEGRTEREIAKFSAKDAARYGAYQAEIGRVADVLRSLVLEGAAQSGAAAISADSVRELGKLAAIGKRLWQDDAVKAAFSLIRKSAGDMLDDWFESDPIKAVLGFDAVVGNLASPYTPGSAYVLLHHVLRRSERQARRVGPRHRRHGRDHAGDGARRRPSTACASMCGAAVREIIVERGRATGVVLEDGTPIRARAVIANVDPQQPVPDPGAARGGAAARWRRA